MYSGWSMTVMSLSTTGLIIGGFIAAPALNFGGILGAVNWPVELSKPMKAISPSATSATVSSVAIDPILFMAISLVFEISKYLASKIRLYG